MRIRVTTRTNLEKRKHIERGYRIEDNWPAPVNGFGSFIAVQELPVSDRLTELVAQLSMETAVRVTIIEVLNVAQNPFSF